MAKWRKLFKTRTPDLEKYKGKFVVIDGKRIEIKHMVGNKFKPTFYEINGEHLIGMLRFHAQMVGDVSITEQQFLDFENMDLHAEPMKPEMDTFEKAKRMKEVLHEN